MTDGFVAPKLRPEDRREFPDPKTWRCACGHPLYRHSHRRRPGSGEYDLGPCHVDGCACEKGESETDYVERVSALGADT